MDFVDTLKEKIDVRALELKVPPLLLTAVFLAAIVAVVFVFPALVFPIPYSRYMSAGLMLAGVSMLLGAALQFRLHHTTLDPRNPAKASKFVARGLFRISRNPMYFGMALVLASVTTWTCNALGFLLVALFCLYLTEFQIKPEEATLEALFGVDYRAYKSSVRRWI